MTTHKLNPRFIGHPLDIDLVGCGGNGSQMLTGLARMHIALQAVGHPGITLRAYDPDIVTEANVGRQLFSPSDVGQNKARVLIHRLNCYYNMNWTAVAGMSDGHSGPANFVVGCVDSIRSRRAINRACHGYWLDLGNSDKTGQVILGAPRREWNLNDQTRPLTILEIFPKLNRGKIIEDNAPSCSLAAALERQDLFINQSVATFALQLLWSFIRSGELIHQGYYINLTAGRVTPIPIPQPKPGLPLTEVFAKN